MVVGGGKACLRLRHYDPILHKVASLANAHAAAVAANLLANPLYFVLRPRFREQMIHAWRL